jgi:hypothetical protein
MTDTEDKPPCPRWNPEMTFCVVRDGVRALADGNDPKYQFCAGCSIHVSKAELPLRRELEEELKELKARAVKSR